MPTQDEGYERQEVEVIPNLIISPNPNPELNPKLLDWWRLQHHRLIVVLLPP